MDKASDSYEHWRGQQLHLGTLNSNLSSKLNSPVRHVSQPRPGVKDSTATRSEALGLPNLIVQHGQEQANPARHNRQYDPRG